MSKCICEFYKENSERILLYDVDEVVQRVFRFVLAYDYNIFDVTDSFTDLIAIKAVALFINVEKLTNEQLAILNDTYKEDANATMVVFSGEPPVNMEFEYHVVNLAEDRDSKLSILFTNLKRRMYVTPEEVVVQRKHLNEVVVMDCEVYGTNSNNGEIVSLDAAYIKDGVEVERIHKIIKPMSKVKRKKWEIDTITIEEIEQGENPQEAFRELVNWHNEAQWYACNADFHQDVMDRALWNNDIDGEISILDLRCLTINKMPNILKHRMMDLAKRFSWNENNYFENSISLFMKIYWEYCI